MPYRRSQVEKIKEARKAWMAANERGGTREQRREASAVLDALQRTSTPEELKQGYAEHVDS